MSTRLNTMMKLKSLLFFFLGLNALFLKPTLVQAQLSHGGFPMELPTTKSLVSTHQSTFMTHILTSEIEQFDAASISTEKTLRFAYPVKVSLNTHNSGSWQTLGDVKIWTLNIVSAGANSLNLIFDQFQIPEGGRLYIFTPDKEIVRGAFTHQNVQPSNMFSIFPIPGEAITLQYEEPSDVESEAAIEISQISHGYKSVLSKGDARRPLGLSGSCNVNANCDSKSEFKNQVRSVCRILTAGIEFSTGNLINNALNDGTPYVLGAFHAFDSVGAAKTAVFEFNYESPGCYNIDGDNHFTLSGATAVASSDSVDFMFVRLNDAPPAEYRPYYSGWDCSKVKPSSTHTIHHPNADTKKISYDQGVCDSMKYSKYLPYGFWRISSWEVGTTEAGSSGASLYNKDQRIVGTLTGGSASCTKIEADYFSRFDYEFNHFKSNQRQLKVWLDPLNTGVTSIDGYDPYFKAGYNCLAATNFREIDDYVLLSTNNDDSTSSIYTGNNSVGITQFAERFLSTQTLQISGISLGIAKAQVVTGSGILNIFIYQGVDFPETLVAQTSYSIGKLAKGAMNYIPFAEPVSITGNFFVCIQIPDQGEVIQVYQSTLRDSTVTNSLYFLKNDQWMKSSELFTTEKNSASLLLQVLYCGKELIQDVDTLLKTNDLFFLYPNPASSEVMIEFNDLMPLSDIYIYDMMGRLLITDCIEDQRTKDIDVSGLIPGLYFVKSENNGVRQVKRLMIK